MFKRSIELKLAKPSKSAKTETTEDHTPQMDYYADMAKEAGRGTAKAVAALIGTYMAADTLRKVTIHIVATKIK